MTVQEIMERAGTTETRLTVAWIRDAIDLMQSNTKENLKVKKITLYKNKRNYDLPPDLIAIDSISLLDTEDDSKYKIIRRLASSLTVVEDTNP